MSASALREGTRHDIEKLMEEHRGYLSDRQDDFPTMCRTQGIVRGLSMALDQLNNRYKDLNG